jgi:hypothetical protein
MAQKVIGASNFIFVYLIEQRQIYMTQATQTVSKVDKMDIMFKRSLHWEVKECVGFTFSN